LELEREEIVGVEEEVVPLSKDDMSMQRGLEEGVLEVSSIIYVFRFISSSLTC